MDDEGSGGFIVILIIAVIYLWSSLGTANKKIDELQTDYDYCKAESFDKQTTIDNLNSEIETAQSEAWTNYQNMGEVLENLQTY